MVGDANVPPSDASGRTVMSSRVEVLPVEMQCIMGCLRSHSGLFLLVK